MEISIRDFPKICSPFLRKTINNNYVVTPKIDKNYSWVFKDGVRAVDKLNGTNICIRIKKGNISRIFNRTTEKFIFNVSQTRWEGAAMEGIAKAIQRGWLAGKEGDYYGELIGEIFNSNPHKIQGHLFVPFDYLRSKCYWRSWSKNQYPKDFETISEWFKELPSLFNQRLKLPEIKAEGLVFYHHDGRQAKLRRDMFDWFKGDKHKNINKV